MTYTREAIEHLVPAIWDSEAAWGIRNPYVPDPDMPRAAPNPKTGGTLLAMVADIKVAWARAPLTMPERRSVFLMVGQGLTGEESAHVLQIPRRTVQEQSDRAVGKLTAWLNGDEYVAGYGIDDLQTREDVQV